MSSIQYVKKPAPIYVGGRLFQNLTFGCQNAQIEINIQQVVSLSPSLWFITSTNHPIYHNPSTRQRTSTHKKTLHSLYFTQKEPVFNTLSIDPKVYI